MILSFAGNRLTWSCIPTVSSKTMEENDRETYHRFIAALKGPEKLTIPSETLYGAINHYLTTLSNDNLLEFVDTLVQSDKLWNANDPSGIREAFRLASAAKLLALKQSFSSAWLKQARINRQLRQWGDTLAHCLLEASSTERRTQCMIGLLRGFDGDEVCEVFSESSCRTQIEEEIVLLLAKMGADPSEDANLFVSDLGEVVDILRSERLKALNPRGILTEQRQSWLRDIGSQAPSGADTIARGKIISRCFTILDHGGPSSREYAWGEIRTLLSDLISISSDSERKTPFNSETLEAFVHISQSVLDSVQRSKPLLDDQTSPDPTVQTMADILVILSDISSTGRKESRYSLDTTILQILDVVSAKANTSEVHNLFSRILHGDENPDRGAFVLVVAQQLIHQISERTFRKILLPLCNLYIQKPEYPQSFEAAHAYMVAVFEALQKEGAEEFDGRMNMVSHLAPDHAELLLEQSKRGHLTDSELVRSFSTVCVAAARYDPAILDHCVALLDLAAIDAASPFDHTLRLLRIAVSIGMPVDSLDAHLDAIRDVILALPPADHERSELVRALFNTIMRDLSDHTKRRGIEWWLRYQHELRGGDPGDALRAKL
ncbi:hypothetical protein BD324DRAFT_623975 [Kockovaella imperatae]|uniref:Armadillo-type protein n=1 Tax=Kockovaella imperatae TaxID=4999 RepID=A0A1Y1UIU7_9TREE|nr:hypothetical protein BD324DRAFT_623975 [Kockovaella imperatae]ORX37961.1 hypothetical protein BD324DRAFT_623975 [Kockovaella imperatae]